ncbi:MAG TPA: FAD-binding oxidoreductase [Methanosarcinales archaeon]|nr:FAD-binding oxidoreductase [Methanosarcinales archaeon]
MAILKELQKIVGEEYATDDIAITAGYSRDQHWNFVPPKNPSYIVLPGNKEEVREILRFANKEKVPVIPWSTGINIRGLTIPVYDNSILLDLSRLNHIIEISEEMQSATIEPAVTFGMLLEETKKVGLRPAFPDAPLTVSALNNNYLRGIYQSAAGDGIDHVLSFEIILPNGKTLQTGSRLLSKELPYFRYGPGPEIASLFIGSPGTWGVVTELTLKLYQIFDNQNVYYVGFDDIDTPMKFIKKINRGEIVSSCRLVDHTSWLEGILGTFDYDYENLPKFVAVLAVEGQDGIFKAKDSLLKKYIKESGGKLLDEIPKELATNLKCELLGAETSSMVFGLEGNYYCIGFYGPLTLTPTYYKSFKKITKEVGIPEKYVHFYLNAIARFHGQACYNELDIFYDSSDKEFVEKLKKLHSKLTLKLLEIGIYGWFRPYAGVIQPTLERLGYFAEFWKKLQDLVDPNHIMNPGKLW